MTNPEVYFDIALNHSFAGRVTMTLFADSAPLAAENFRVLCAGEKKAENTALHYQGTPFHRVIPDFVLQGGDTTKGNGTGGLSIYGAEFADENLDQKHDREGLLSMTNSGPNTNNSQFMITTRPTPELDGRHTVFGEVTKNMDLVRKIEALGSPRGATSATVTITECGQL
nr:peptidylprolyl isomerase [Streptomyces anulatus]